MYVICGLIFNKPLDGNFYSSGVEGIWLRVALEIWGRIDSGNIVRRGGKSEISHRTVHLMFVYAYLKYSVSCARTVSVCILSDPSWHKIR